MNRDKAKRFLERQKDYFLNIHSKAHPDATALDIAITALETLELLGKVISQRVITREFEYDRGVAYRNVQNWLLDLGALDVEAKRLGIEEDS